jgi:alpha-L-fucosidase 2
VKTVKMCMHLLMAHKITSAVFCLFLGLHQFSIAETSKPIDWPAFIARQDMVWDKVPTHWLEAPYLGNGMLGLLVFQEGKNGSNPESTNDKNVLSLHLGRGDYYDNRPPINGSNHTWIYRGRLPIGFFKIRSEGDVTGVDWRLDLWNGKLVGTVKTTAGSYTMEGLVHADFDSFMWNVTEQEGEKVSFEWQPQESYSHPRRVCEQGVERAKAKGEEPSDLQKNFTKMPYPKAPEAEVFAEDGYDFSRQILYADSGEQITGWKVVSNDRSHTLFGTIAFSQELGVSLPKVKSDLARTLKDAAEGKYVPAHESWWNAYYPQSFVSLSDGFWEQFYWIQMYKFASATRSNGMMLDVMGPWYQPGFWPMIWTDLNVQLTYWTHLTANRLKVGESLVNKTDQYAGNLIKNVPEDWQEDCLNADTIFPADMIAPVGKSVPDHMVWMLHNYWLQCRFADDGEKMRDGLFPLLKRAVNTYLRYLEVNPLDLGDGKIHIKNSWSPEYPGGRGVDINYTIALIRWSCRTLLEINEEHGLNDPKAKDWKHLLENVVDFQTDETGLRIGKDIPFDKAHRHYSHLLAFYPLFDLTPDKDRDLLKRSVDHWLAVTQNVDNKKDQARSVTGYTCTGAASMYSALGDGKTALEYLNILPFQNVSCTTMYAEGNPVIESPFSAATAIHDMLLQSWDGRIRIMPAVPPSWKDVHFRSLLCQGGVEVSAERSGGTLRGAVIHSPNRDREVSFKMEMENPAFVLLVADGTKTDVALKADAEGFYTASIPASGSLLVSGGLEGAEPIKSSPEDSNIFGFSRKYDEVISRLKK